MTEDKIRELFREMRDEPVPGDSKARVRMAVAERTQSWQERLRGRWKVAALVLVPVCAVLIALAVREPVRISTPAAPVVAPPVVAEKTEPVVAARAPVDSPPASPVVRVRREAVKPRSAPVAEAATLIRIETPDPNVVILLVGG